MPRPKQFDEKEVLNKAMELFWAKGFHATSMQDLVSNIGINRASIYDTYGDKETLFKKAFDLYRNNSQESLKSFFKEQDSVKQGFALLFENMITDATANHTARKGCFVVNATTELAPEDASLSQIIRNNMNQVISIFENFIQHGITSGEIDSSKNPKQLALFIFTIYNGIQILTKIDASTEELTSITDVALSVLD